MLETLQVPQSDAVDPWCRQGPTYSHQYTPFLTQYIVKHEDCRRRSSSQVIVSNQGSQPLPQVAAEKSSCVHVRANSGCDASYPHTPSVRSPRRGVNIARDVK